MTRLRFRPSASMTLVLMLAVIQTGSAQTLSKTRIPSSETLGPVPMANSPVSAASNSAKRTYKIYSLGDFGNDPALCEWIAQAIPEAIAVGTWGGQGTIRYFAPKNILMVCHTSEVHAQVDGFLNDVKKSLSDSTKAKAATAKNLDVPSEVVQARYKVELPKAVKTTPGPSPSYPMPAQAKAPKHLFHFIIRYEGEGIIDDNVVKAMKDYSRAATQASQAAPVAPPPPPAGNVAVTVSPNSPPAPTPSVKPKEEKTDEKEPEQTR